MKEEEEKKQLTEGLQEAADIVDVPMNGKAPMLYRAMSNGSTHLERSLSIASGTTKQIVSILCQPDEERYVELCRQN